jgi:uncharacterized protein (UPF0332 family)
MMNDRLIRVARELSQRTGHRPREAFMRRAVSTAYYAMFHALARLCADELIGAKHARTAPWNRVYRALDHKAAKTVLQSSEATALSSVIADFGNAFAHLQERRHQADYDPAPFQYYFSGTEALVELAHSAIQKLDSLKADERRTLAVLILFKQR